MPLAAPRALSLRAAYAVRVAGIAASFGCADGTAPASAPRIAFLGPIERGASSVVRIVRGADTLAGPVTLSLRPDSSRATVRGDTLRFAAVGLVTIRATAGDVSVDSIVVVASPPTVVYQASPSGNADLFAIDLDGTNPRTLTTNAAEDAMPTVARNRIVFVSRRSGARELWSLPVAGGTATQLTTTAADEEQPALSADGTRLAWIVPSSGTAVWVGDGSAVGGARFAPADVGAAPLESSPSWATSNSLIYATVRDSGTYVIYRGTVGAATGSATRVVGATRDSLRLEPAVSPDGRWLAITTDKSGGPGTALLLADAASGQIQARLVPGTAIVASPRWLDNDRVVFVGAASPTTRQLFWVDRRRPGAIVAVPGTVGASRPAPVR